jgi:hypothetical protein
MSVRREDFRQTLDGEVQPAARLYRMGVHELNVSAYLEWKREIATRW